MIHQHLPLEVQIYLVEQLQPDSADAFVYEVKFVDGAPVAIDGEVVITGFDASTDTLTLQASSVPSGFTKSSLLTATGVDVTTNTIDNYTLTAFAPTSGASGSIRLDGVVDGDLSSLNNILSGSVHHLELIYLQDQILSWILLI